MIKFYDLADWNSDKRMIYCEKVVRLFKTL